MPQKKGISFWLRYRGSILVNLVKLVYNTKQNMSFDWIMSKNAICQLI